VVEPGLVSTSEASPLQCTGGCHPVSTTPAGATAHRLCRGPRVAESRSLRVVTSLAWTADGPNLAVHGDNLPVIRDLPDDSFRLIYLDPPFNTGRTQTRQALRTVRSESGRRIGFKGQTYETVKGMISSYDDSFADYWAFLEPRLEQAHRLLSQEGTLYLHLDYREVHYAKVLLDALFGRECFLNEIIWAYDYGARSKKKWPTKHDNILVYVKNPECFYFNSEEVDREPYMAPGLVTAEKAAKGKLPTDVWWHTIVSPTGPREDRLRNTEAAGDNKENDPGQLRTRRLGHGFLCWKRHSWRSCERSRSPFRVGRQQR